MKFKGFKKLIEENGGVFLIHDMVDEYHIFLVKWGNSLCDVGLSYKDMPFMFPGQQEQMSGFVPKDFMSIAKSLLMHLAEYCDIYEDELLIRVASHNTKKIAFYHKIINHYLSGKVFTSNIINDPMVNYFIVSSKPISIDNTSQFNESFNANKDVYKELKVNISAYTESSTITKDLLSAISNFDKTLYKVFRLSEDAMGGISAPFSTLYNTPGVGNAIPAGSATNWFGSGDSWSNVINDKPYTQSSKRKKRKKRKVTESDNINPYDKLGNSIAKALKLKTPFKKTKSKYNQNSMKQNIYEASKTSSTKSKKISAEEFMRVRNADKTKFRNKPFAVTKKKIQSLLLLLTNMDKYMISLKKSGKPQVITNMHEWISKHNLNPNDRLTDILFNLKFKKITSNRVRSSENSQFQAAGVWKEQPYPKGVTDNFQLLFYAIYKNSQPNWGMEFDENFVLRDIIGDNPRLLLLFYIMLEVGSQTKGVPFPSKYIDNLNIARDNFDLDNIDISQI